MAISGRVGIKLKDGNFLSFHNHYESFPDKLGIKLKKEYTDYDSVLSMVQNGKVYEDDEVEELIKHGY